MPHRLSVGKVTLILTLIVCSIALWAMTSGTTQVESIRMGLRITARMSLTLFLLAFSAAALAKLFPNDFTAWLRRNRRALGLAFAVSHGWHLLAILSLARLDPALFATLTNPFSIAFGSLTYLFIAMMAATSFDTTARMVGPRAWRWIHTIGIWLVWTVFMTSEAKRVAGQPVYAVGVALLLGAVALRLVAARMGKERSDV